MTTTEQDGQEIEKDWTTVEVTALPTGWRCVFRGDDGPFEVPAVCLMRDEHQANFVYGASGLTTQDLEPPFDTTVMFGIAEPNGGVASVEGIDNLMGILAPGEDLEAKYREAWEQGVGLLDDSSGSGVTLLRA